MKKIFFIIAGIVLLFGCASRTTPAPIVNVTKMSGSLQTDNASNNGDSGAKLGTVKQDEVKTVPDKVESKPAVEAPAPVAAPVAADAATWVSPTDGTITKKFTLSSKGVDYTGQVGQDVVAINDGKVVYSGNGLKGYGNLIIIKHDKTYLSAYANNQKNIIKEGDMVKRGQKIAAMGKGRDGKALLHFEVRKNGKPIDPTSLIK